MRALCRLVRFPASWNQLAEKESHQINNLEQILVAKVFNFCGICSKCPHLPNRFAIGSLPLPRSAGEDNGHDLQYRNLTGQQWVMPGAG
jgi:hypothetical protein